MGEDIDNLIGQMEQELAPYLDRMELLKAQFSNQTIAFASDWYKKTAKEYVAKYPDVALKMSEEKIGRMKLEINNLVANTEKIVKEEYGRPTLWWHERPHLHDAIDQYLQVADKYPELVDRAVRRVLGHLGLVLEDYKFNVTGRGVTSTFKEFWFERPIITDKAVPCYPHLLRWTPEMQETIRLYNDQYTQAVGIFTEICELKDEKRKQQALNRWNSF
jgi:hypothetical protein